MSDLRELIRDGQHSLPDKDYGWIVLILRNGFIFVGDTKRVAGVGILRGFQVRYYDKRDGGLPEFASDGRKSGDKLDAIVGELEFPWSQANVIGVLPCGDNWKKLS
jgi:hypothetical protein